MTPSPYAWLIDQDHLSGPGGRFYNPAKPGDHCVGICGPRDVDLTTDEVDSDDHAVIRTALERNYEHRHQFRMYDDDGILYVTGTLFWNGDPDDPDSADDGDEVCYAPLRDYGAGGLGCALIKYTGRPEWDCG
jgi:hypothetical protein